jgi:hypothetical protein
LVDVVVYNQTKDIELNINGSSEHVAGNLTKISYKAGATTT